MSKKGSQCRWRFPTILCALVATLSLGWAQPLPPTLNALAAIVIDADTGQVLYSKNAELPLPPASTTKIMTGLLLAEKCEPDEVITAPADTTQVRESSMHLVAGEQVKAEEMLYALMLRSANDGCHAVACHIAGSDAEFAKVMNSRAKQIGCTHTNFVNPHGLNDPKHLTTAHDLALIAREAMQNELFAKVVGTQRKAIERSSNLKDTLMVTRDKWLALDPSAKGVKTGFTKEAGHCFVGCAQRGDMTVITAIMKSDTWLQDQIALTDWAYKTFERRKVVSKGEKLFSVPVTGGKAKSVELVADRDVFSLQPKAGPSVGAVSDKPTVVLKAPISKGQVCAESEFVAPGGVHVPFGLVSETAVEAQPPVYAMLTNPVSLVIFVALGGSALWMRARSRRLADLEWSRR